MKIIRFCCLVLWLLAASRPGARAQACQTNINPALLYYQAFLLAPKFDAADEDYLKTNAWQGRPLPDRLERLLQRHHTELEFLHAARAPSAPCDWGLDTTRGPNTLLPHLSLCKLAAIAACRQAKWALQQGDEAGATADLLGAFTLGRNAAAQGFQIGVLVQMAIEAMVYQTVAENFGEFSPAGLRQLEAGLAGSPAGTSLADALQKQRQIYGGWLVNKVQAAQRLHPGNEAAVWAALRADATMQYLFSAGDGSPDTNAWPRIFAAANGTSDGVIQLVQDLDPIYERLNRIMTLPGPAFAPQARAFDEAITNSPNPLATYLLPVSLPGRRKEFNLEVEAAMLQAAVAYKCNGPTGSAAVTDPGGQGPLACQRFVFQGQDRGLQLTSAWVPDQKPLTMIFVETPGPAFSVMGVHAGEAVNP